MKKIAIIISIVLAFGAFLRFWSLGDQSLWIDEGYTINASFSVADRGLPILDSGAFYRNGVLTTYLAAVAGELISFDPHSPWSARLPAALFGTSLILAVYAASRAFYKDEYAACAAAAVVAFSYWEIAWSRQTRGYAGVALFLLLTGAFLCEYLDGKKAKHLLYGGISFAIAFGLHEIAKVALPGFVAVSAAYLLTKDLEPRKRASAIISFSFVAIAFLYAALDFLPIFTSSDKLRIFASFTPELILLSILSIIGLVLAFFDKERLSAYCVVFSFVLVTAATVAIYNSAPQLRYMFPLHPFLVLLSVYAIKRVVDMVRALRSEKGRGLATIALTLAAFFPFLHAAPVSHYWLEPGSPQPDFNSAFKSIESIKEKGDAIISPYAQLHKVYLGEKGYWLKMNLSGRQGRVESRIVNGVDYYAAAPVIEDLEALKKQMERGSGFVVLDSMARAKLRDIVAYLEDGDFEVIWDSEGEGDASRVTVFRY